MLNVVINGERRSLNATTIGALVHELGLDGRKVAIERNLEIVSKSRFAATPVTDGDLIEIVHFIGGG